MWLYRDKLIAVALGLPVSTVKSRLYRTTAEMRSRLDARARLSVSGREVS